MRQDQEKTRKDRRTGIWTDILGERAYNEVLEFYLEGRGLDFSVGTVAKKLDMNRTTAYNAVEELLEKELLTKTREVSGAQMYKFNESSFHGKLVLSAYKAVMRKLAHIQVENNAPENAA